MKKIIPIIIHSAKNGNVFIHIFQLYLKTTLWDIITLRFKISVVNLLTIRQTRPRHNLHQHLVMNQSLATWSYHNVFLNVHNTHHDKKNFSEKLLWLYKGRNLKICQPSPTPIKNKTPACKYEGVVGHFLNTHTHQLFPNLWSMLPLQKEDERWKFWMRSSFWHKIMTSVVCWIKTWPFEMLLSRLKS